MTKHAAGEAILTGMVSLGIHLILGAAVIAWLIRSNPQIFSRVPGGPAFSTLTSGVASATGVAAGTLASGAGAGGAGTSVTAVGAGLPGSRRLMDEFEVEGGPGRGTRVRMVAWVGPRDGA